MLRLYLISCHDSPAETHMSLDGKLSIGGGDVAPIDAVIRMEWQRMSIKFNWRIIEGKRSFKIGFLPFTWWFMECDFCTIVLLFLRILNTWYDSKCWYLGYLWSTEDKWTFFALSSAWKRANMLDVKLSSSDWRYTTSDSAASAYQYSGVPLVRRSGKLETFCSFHWGVRQHSFALLLLFLDAFIHELYSRSDGRPKSFTDIKKNNLITVSEVILH